MTAADARQSFRLRLDAELIERAIEFVEPRECGVEVCLVEYLAAANEVAVDREDADHPPLGVEVLVGNAARGVREDRSEVAQPVHSLGSDAEVRCEVPVGMDGCGQITRVDRYDRPMVRVGEVWRCCGAFVPVEAGVES